MSDIHERFTIKEGELIPSLQVLTLTEINGLSARYMVWTANKDCERLPDYCYI